MPGLGRVVRHRIEQVAQGIELVIHVGPIARNPRIDLGERSWLKPVVPETPLHALLDQASVFQHRELLADGRLEQDDAGRSLLRSGPTERSSTATPWGGYPHRMNLNQVTLPSLDVARSIHFYEMLGFSLIVDNVPDYARFELPRGDATLSVERVASIGLGPRAVIYFECDDLDERVGRLQARGIAFDSEPADMPWLWREARLHDPDANPLCLYRAGANRLHPPWRVRR